MASGAERKLFFVILLAVVVLDASTKVIAEALLLRTAGFPVLGEYQGYKSGHTLHLKLLQALAAQPDHWEIVPDKGLREARAG